MSHATDSKQAQAYLIDPLNAPEPSAETGPGAHFGSTYAPAQQSNGNSSPASSKNPYRSSMDNNSPPASKSGVTSTVRPSKGSSPRGGTYEDYRATAFGGELDSRRRAGSHGGHGTPPTYQEATTSGEASGSTGRRRGSSLKERYPGDKSGQPLDVIRRDSRKANRSPHLKKQSLPGADMVDRLDPAIGGRAYHHEGPFDAALMSRNRDPKTAPLGALQTSNQEALKATPAENIKDAVERHQPLDGTAIVPPGEQDRFGRTYNYEEGADLMHEPASGDAGYKRWPGKDYDPEDLKGESEPSFGLDRAMKAHRIDDRGIEMDDRSHINREYHDQQRKGKLDPRDPVEIAGDDGKYVDYQIRNGAEQGDVHGVRQDLREGMGSLKKRIGSLRHRNKDD